MGSTTYSHLVNLEVLEAQAMLEGGSEMHLEAGSSFQLVCRVATSSPPPAYVFWYKGDAMVNYDFSSRSFLKNSTTMIILTIWSVIHKEQSINCK